MTYVEKMTMKIMGEMAYNYGNQLEVAEVVRQIIADTKRACKAAIEQQFSVYTMQIDQAEVKKEGE